MLFEFEEIAPQGAIFLSLADVQVSLLSMLLCCPLAEVEVVWPHNHSTLEKSRDFVP